MCELRIPLRIDDLWQDDADSNDYGFNSLNIDRMSLIGMPEMVERLDTFMDGRTELSDFDITNGFVNDTFLWTLKEFVSASAELKCSVAEALLDLSKLSLDQASANLSNCEKDNAKKILYFFVQFAVKAETSATKDVSTIMPTSSTSDKAKGKASKKKTSSNGFAWTEYRKEFLTVLDDLSSTEIGQFWTMGIIEETFTSSIWSYCLNLLEERPSGIAGSAGQEVSTRAQCMQIIAKMIKHFGSISTSGSYVALCTAMIDAMMRAEHMSSYVAEICRYEAISTKNCFLTNELIGEVSKMNMSLLPAQGVKNISGFVEALAKVDPNAFSLNIPVIIKQIDSSAHQMRSSMLQAMGHVVMFIHKEVTRTFEPSEATGEEKNNEDRLRNNSLMLRQRDSLLNIMIERTHDINPFTRASLLKVWASLMDAQAVPVKRVGSIGEVALDRLQDKNSFVRRSAIALLTSILDANPFSSKLDLNAFEQQKKEIEMQMETRLQELSESTGLIPNAPLKKDPEGEGEDEDDDADEVDEEELMADANADEIMADLRLKADYFTSAVELMKAINAALPKISSMLESKNVSDITESLSFLSRAVNFQVIGALDQFRCAFKLVWHQDAGVKSELNNCFVQVYFTDGAKEDAENLSAKEISLNLIKLAQSCDESQIISLEEIIANCMSHFREIDELMSALISRANAAVESRRKSGVYRLSLGADMKADTMSDLAAAMLVISMVIVKASPRLALETLPALIKSGFDEQVFNKKDFDALKMTSLCLEKIFLTVEKSASVAVAAVSEGVKDELLVHLQSVVTMGTGLRDNESAQWFSAAEEAIHCIFKLHPNPDVIMDGIIKHIHSKLFGKSVCGNSQLAAFLFTLGQTALCTVVYTERVAAAVKASLKEKIEKGNYDGSNKTDKGASKEGDIADFEEQMGVTAAVEAEHDQEVAYMIERELALENLLGKFLPLISYIVANETGAFSHPIVRGAAVLALCRYMSISSAVCEMSLPLLFTVLERELSTEIRTTITVALGDLAFRFPNTLEPWTSRLYSRLRDENLHVRYNTLVVITHLVLNDMIKVKGQVSHVAMALTDPEKCIRDMARLLFIKLSERSNNPIYNLLGDIISNFSRESVAESSEEPSQVPLRQLSAEEFQNTMHFLLSFVSKDKQADLLLERLLIRLAAAESPLQRQNLAFCISELTVSEKGLKKLIEVIKTLRLALLDGVVFEHFMTLLSRAKKSRFGAGSAAATTADVDGSAAASAGATQQGEGGASAGVSKSTVEEAEAALHAAIATNEDGSPIQAVPSSGESEEAPENGSSRNVSKKAPSKAKASASSKGKKSGKSSSKSKKSRYDDSDEGEDDENDELLEDDADENDENQMNRRGNTRTEPLVSKSLSSLSTRKNLASAAPANRRRVIVDEDEEF